MPLLAWIIVYERRDQALQIPRTAIVDNEDGPTVFVVEKDKADQRPIRIGLRPVEVPQHRAHEAPVDQDKLPARGQRQGPVEVGLRQGPLPPPDPKIAPGHQGRQVVRPAGQRLVAGAQPVLVEEVRPQPVELLHARFVAARDWVSMYAIPFARDALGLRRPLGAYLLSGASANPHELARVAPHVLELRVLGRAPHGLFERQLLEGLCRRDGRT